MTTQRLPATTDDPIAPTQPSRTGVGGIRSSRAGLSPGLRPAVGPTVHLPALPTSDGLDLTVAPEVDGHLSQIEEVRQRQLDAMPAGNLDAVSAAHRRRVEQILEEVRTVRGRLAAGLYGICVRCAGAISTDRLEVRPWASGCASCASGDRT